MKQKDSTFLMANLGSEITRMLVARDERNTERLKGAYTRAVEILSSISILPEMKSREVELELLKKVVDDFVKGEQSLSVTPKFLKSYFRPFALRAMSV